MPAAKVPIVQGTVLVGHTKTNGYYCIGRYNTFILVQIKQFAEFDTQYVKFLDEVTMPLATLQTNSCYYIATKWTIMIMCCGICLLWKTLLY